MFLVKGGTLSWSPMTTIIGHSVVVAGMVIVVVITGGV
jgi:hypothetical protein